MEAVGGFLRGVRKARGLDVEDVSALVSERFGYGVSRATLYRLEQGKTGTGSDVFTAVINVLGVPMERIQELAASDLSAKDSEQMGIKSGGGKAVKLPKPKPKPKPSRVDRLIAIILDPTKPDEKARAEFNALSPSDQEQIRERARRRFGL